MNRTPLVLMLALALASSGEALAQPAAPRTPPTPSKTSDR